MTKGRRRRKKIGHATMRIGDSHGGGVGGGDGDDEGRAVAAKSSTPSHIAAATTAP